MKIRSILLLTVLSCLYMAGCGGGGGEGLTIGVIVGSSSLVENTSANYTITVSGDTGITYLWAVDPATAGTFTNGTTSAATYHAGAVTADTDVTISVTVTSDSYGPEIVSVVITITDEAVDAGWALTWGGNFDDWAYGTTVGASGNIYVIGRFSDVVDFDPGSGAANFSSAGDDDAFLVKFNAEGNYEWCWTWGGIGKDNAYGVTEDNAGNVYVVGGFEDTVDFDPTSGVEEWTAFGQNDAYLVVFDSDGVFQWSQAWGGTLGDCAGALAVSDTGDIYVVGSFEDVVDFDPGAGSDDHTSAGIKDCFLSKFDSTGIWQWAATWGGTGYDGCSDIAIDGLGIILAIGFFRDTVDFNPGAGTANFASNGGSDAYLNVFDSDGNYQWARTWGGLTFDTAYGVIGDGFGNAYVTGLFEDTVDFDTGATSDNRTSAGSYDAYLTVFDSVGDYQTALTWGGTGDDLGKSLIMDSSGGFYLIGEFEDTCDLDPGAATNNFISAGSHDIYITRFDSSYNYDWAQAWGDVDWDRPYGLAIDGSDNAYLAGHFSGTIDFDPGADTDDHTAVGDDDAFLVKILPNGFWE